MKTLLAEGEWAVLWAIQLDTLQYPTTESPFHSIGTKVVGDVLQRLRRRGLVSLRGNFRYVLTEVGRSCL